MCEFDYDASAFAACFRHFDHVLKRTKFADKSRKRLEVDWVKFAESLGQTFFEEVRESGSANTLIGEPPRILMSEGENFEPLLPEPIANVVDLFRRGVCQVRHNYFHGEKFVGTVDDIERDHTLVREAHRVLQLAAAHHPTLGDKLHGNGNARSASQDKSKASDLG